MMEGKKQGINKITGKGKLTENETHERMEEKKHKKAMQLTTKRLRERERERKHPERTPPPKKRTDEKEGVNGCRLIQFRQIVCIVRTFKMCAGKSCF
jgi:hypothetical protein